MSKGNTGEAGDDDFNLANAVTALQNSASSINSLWTVYVGANFAFAGFGLAVHRLSPIVASLLTVGYLCFTSGHFVLVKRAIEAGFAIAKDIRSVIGPDMRFRDSVTAISRIAYPSHFSLAAHIVCDACIVAIIWWRALSDGAQIEI